ncbi:MAG: AmmeMemoRadiSam system protein A [Coriobacteriales bacterium]|nr:AmmeMemoRadiSam system protein A [Coriobacteriales bacterium]
MPIVGAFVMPHPPLIIPSVGRGREREIKATVDACNEVARRIAALKPHTIVISSPHATLYRDYFHISPGRVARGSFAQYGAPQAAYEATYDTRLVRAIVNECNKEGIAAGTDYERDARLDHGTMIALHFIQSQLEDFDVVRIGLSGFSPAEHYRLGMAVQRAARGLDRRVVWLASGDLSHKLLKEGPYGFVPEGPAFDKRITADFASGDLVDVLAMDPSLCERAAECGLRSFQMMAGALDRTRVRAELLSYEGPFGVGYGVAAFEPLGEEGACEDADRLAAYLARRQEDLCNRRGQEDPYVQLARQSLEAYVREGTRVQPSGGLPGELLSTRAGCFVSLKVDGSLRGCIGTIAPTKKSLAEEICANAISAGTRDPRFRPVTASELDELVYDVDVLTTPEAIASKADLDPSRYGVIVSTKDGRRGLLLPDLDGVDDVDQQIRIAAQKGRIDLDFDDYQLERFEVVRHL